MLKRQNERPRKRPFVLLRQNPLQSSQKLREKIWLYLLPKTLPILSHHPIPIPLLPPLESFNPSPSLYPQLRLPSHGIHPAIQHQLLLLLRLQPLLFCDMGMSLYQSMQLDRLGFGPFRGLWKIERDVRYSRTCTTRVIGWVEESSSVAIGLCTLVRFILFVGPPLMVYVYSFLTLIKSKPPRRPSSLSLAFRCYCLPNTYVLPSTNRDRSLGSIGNSDQEVASSVRVG